MDTYIKTPVKVEQPHPAVESTPAVSETETEPEPEEEEERITSSTLWIGYRTYAVGGDGHRLEVTENSKARDPTYQEMLNFIRADQTDEREYILDEFVCADFAETVQHNAEVAGYNCAYVDITFTDGIGHMCNAFQTTDRGLVFIDCTNSIGGGGPVNNDCVVYIADGGIFKPEFLFPSGGWYTVAMGTVESYKIYWD
ncbi:MAG: hypothetical protein ABFD07_00300 [Methanobacterium sp.]